MRFSRQSFDETFSKVSQGLGETPRTFIIKKGMRK